MLSFDMAKALLSFDEWRQQVEMLCASHLACTWDDLCGEIAPLELAFGAGEDPVAFVHWWAEKYDLRWFNDDRLDFVNFGAGF